MVSSARGLQLVRKLIWEGPCVLDQEEHISRSLIANLQNLHLPLNDIRESLQTLQLAFLESSPLASINLWMNNARSRSSTHYDPHHNLLCVVAGCKQVVLWPPSASSFLYPMPIYGEASNHSSVDIESPDFSMHSRAKNSMNHSQKVILHAGDALYIPEGCWEIRRLIPSSTSSGDKCLVTQMLEINSSGWGKWKKHYQSKFEKTIPYALLCQVAGLREYFGANPALAVDSPSAVVHSKFSNVSGASGELEDSETNDEFYDAIAADMSPEDEDSDESDDSDNNDELSKGGKVQLKNVSWAIANLALKKSSAHGTNTELDARVPPTDVDVSQFHGSMPRGKAETETNCWAAPSGQGFMIRGKTYLKDFSKVMGTDPLLKLLAVDWFIADKTMDRIALDPKRLVQSEAGKKLPFILVINLQVPAKPNYSLVLYYGADRPINKGSLLSKFVDGTDVFRDARFKLIPSIVEGYWMVKRAVGTKACLLGKAVTCKCLRQDNFLEIDVDIGSSSVARSIIGLVLGYVTNIVVDLAILIEATEEEELPEYILGTVRLNRFRLDSAIPF